MFWEIGLTQRPRNYFVSPQNWNSYSYTINNPINLVDPTGEMVDYTKSYKDERTGNNYYKATNFSLADGDFHYKSNINTSVQVSFDEIDTSTIRPEHFNAINARIHAGVEGVYNFGGDDARESFTTNNLKDYTLYGDLSYKAEGILTIDKGGKWDFKGTLKAWDDIYDFTVSRSDWLNL